MEVIKMDNQKMLYSLKISIKELSNEISLILDNNRIEDKNLLYKKIGDVLHWIYDCIEKLDDSNLSSEENDYITAFRGAANAQKHSKIELNFDDFINCAMFPFSLPAVFSDKGLFNWKILPNNIIRYENQIKKYNDLLANHNIIDSLKIIENIIEKNLI